jgi:putative ABC transport system permease protein
MALGASAHDVRAMVVKQGMVTALAGVLIGLAAALGLTRLMASLLYNVTPRDPLAMTSVALLLVGVALAATYIPARRASRVDPIVSLRYE